MEEQRPTIEQANLNYWLARVEMEMPTPETRTLVMLGKAAYLLSRQQVEH